MIQVCDLFWANFVQGLKFRFIIFAHGCPLVPDHLLKRWSFLYLIAFVSLSKIVWAYLCRSVSRPSSVLLICVSLLWLRLGTFVYCSYTVSHKVGQRDFHPYIILCQDYFNHPKSCLFPYKELLWLCIQKTLLEFCYELH